MMPTHGYLTPSGLVPRVICSKARRGPGKAIEGTAAGQTYVDPSVVGKLFTHVAGTTVVHNSTMAESLSPPAREILRLLANGRSNTEIAGQLFLSEGTVRNICEWDFYKAGCHRPHPGGGDCPAPRAGGLETGSAITDARELDQALG